MFEQIESWNSSGGLGGGGIEQKGKRTQGHGQQCGDGWGEEEYKGTIS